MQKLTEDLPAFLDALRSLTFGGAAPRRAAGLAAPAAGKLSAFLAVLKRPLKNAVESGLLGNPWTAASLRRDEVRNAAVLAWLLDPRGGHGYRDAVLRSVLERVALGVEGFPCCPSAACSVSVEECPDGTLDSRVDIQIDDPDRFFLFIEVKIDALEQPRQVERYCRIAEARTRDGRHWAVVFLTLAGRPPETAGPFEAKVVPLPWGSIAAALRRIAAEAGRTGSPAVPRFLARSFADHIMSWGGGRHGRRRRSSSRDHHPEGSGAV